MLRAKDEVKICGRVATMKDLKYTAPTTGEGTASLMFSVAVPQSRRKDDGTYEELDSLFFDLTAYSSVAESINRNVAAYKDATGKIGMPIGVKAVVTQSTKDGVKKQFLKVTEVLFMNAPKKTKQGVVLTNAFVKPCAEVSFAGRVSSTKGLQEKDGKTFLQFGIAQERSIRNQTTGQYENLEPYYWDLVAFGNMAKRIDDYISNYKKEYGSIGLELAVKTDIQTDTWEKEGEKHRKFSFRVNEIEYVAIPRSKSEGLPKSSTTEVQVPPTEKPNESFMTVTEEEEDELPFD